MGLQEGGAVGDTAPHPEQSSPAAGAPHIHPSPSAKKENETFRPKLSENQNMHNAIILPSAPRAPCN